MQLLSNLRRGLSVAMLIGTVAVMAGCQEGRPVRVETDPSGAKIYLNDTYVGESPCDCFITDHDSEALWQNHIIEAEAEGYETTAYDIRYRTGAMWSPKRICLVLSEDPSTATKNARAFAIVREDPPVRPTPATVIASDRAEPQETHEPRPILPSPVFTEQAARRADAARRAPATSAAKRDPRHANDRPPAETRAPAETTEMETELLPTVELPRPVVLRDKNEPPIEERMKNIASRPFLDQWGYGEIEGVERIDPVTPRPQAMLACEVRVVRLRDGMVLGQASTMGTYRERGELARRMVSQLRELLPDGATVSTVSLCNRRLSPIGAGAAEGVTQAVNEALLHQAGLVFVRSTDLRDRLESEDRLEHAETVSRPALRERLGRADYVLIGGVALQQPPNVKLP